MHAITVVVRRQPSVNCHLAQPEDLGPVGGLCGSAFQEHTEGADLPTIVGDAPSSP
jgi:hypothetical protein